MSPRISAQLTSDIPPLPNHIPQSLLQHLPPTVEPGHHGSGGNPGYLRDLRVRESLDIREDDDGPEPLRQREQRVLNFLTRESLQDGTLSGRLDPVLPHLRVEVPVLDVLGGHRLELALLPIVRVERVPHDPVEPSLEVRALPELEEAPIRAEKRLLDEVLRVGAVSGKAVRRRIRPGHER